MQVSKKLGYIISLKFAPGLKKEFTLLGENLAKKGVHIEYLLAEKYKFIGSNKYAAKYVTKSSNLKEIIIDTIKYFRTKNINNILQSNSDLVFILFYNPHILNYFIVRFINIYHKEVQTILYLHDPYKPDKQTYGLAKSLYISIVEILQKMTVKYIDHVISPSQFSQELFLNYYKNYYGTSHLCPLLIPDQPEGKRNNPKVFSIVGGYHSATGHDTFVDLVNYTATKGLDYKFFLISSSNISEIFNRLSEKGRSITKIINKQIINDSEINDVIKRSFAVFRLDWEVTQSGVVPVCYMNSTPIIARDIPGLTQHVQHGYNGCIVPFNCSPADLMTAMDVIMNNFTEMSQNARRSYEEIWAEKNFDQYYSWLISDLS